MSVVVVCYNHSAFLRTCLDSIADQSYGKIQCLIVDNASSDDSRDVIAEFCSSRTGIDDGIDFEPIYSPTNDHLTGAMFRGFANVRGSYVIFVDGDDYLLSACVEAHVKAHLVSRIAVGATSVDMYQSRGDDLVVGTGKTFSKYIMSRKGQKKRFCRMENLEPFGFTPETEGIDLQESDLHLVERSITRDWVWSPTSGLCFRREGVELMFSHRPNIGAGTDNYLVRGISSLACSITIDRALAVYRLHDTNLFTRHPSLENFVSFDKAQLARSDVEVSYEIVECFRKQAKSLAARLELPDTYVEAIDQIARIGPGLKPTPPHSSFILSFLIANRDLLEDAFGNATFKRWRRRYTKIQDYVRQVLGGGRGTNG